MQRTWIILVVFVVISPLVSFGDLNEDLIEAAKNGDTAELRALLHQSTEANTEQRSGWKSSLGVGCTIRST